jgi:tRNA(Ile2)-agmatinylcytidine synthase
MHTAEVSSIEILPRGTTAISTTIGIWMAFSESGDVKNLAQTLKPGDIIEGFGLAPEEGVLHLEKLRIAVKKALRVRPTCSQCERTMKSMGQGQGVRCPECKQRQEVAWEADTSNEEASHWVQPPSDSRRHLARPLEWNESFKHSDKPQNG